MKGRNLGRVEYGDLPEGHQPGDYWRYTHRHTGDDMVSSNPENLTGGVWGCMDPNGGYGILSNHTVREEDDGTISVRPKDGSTNSILITQGDGTSYHGYIEHGEWRSV